MKRTLQRLSFLVCLGSVNGMLGSAAAQMTNVSGLWSGTTRVTPPCAFSSGRCDAVNNITLALKQGYRIKGNYTCSYGNMSCRNGGFDTAGKVVSGRISGEEVRLSVVISADASNCYYNGRLTSPTNMRGGYSCYQGGELVEEGMWNVTRGSAE
jgi:hypothetical protein